MESTKDDFELDCTTTGDEDYFEILCTVKPVSEKMIEKYKNCDIGSIILVKDKDTLSYIEKKYQIPATKTIILEMIRRGKECDKTNSLKNKVGINMLCGLLDFLDIEYIYLFALNDKLVKYYKKFGFRKITNDSYDMVGSVREILQTCENKMTVRKL